MLSRSSDARPPIRPDPLSEVLQDLHLSEVSSGYGELAHPWGISFPEQSPASFHFVASGTCWIASPTGAWIQLEQGDAVLLPDGVGHALSSAPGGPTKPYANISREYIGRNTYRMRESGDGEATLLFCCTVVFGYPGVRPLLELMPSMLLLRAAAQADPLLPTLLDTMAIEVRTERMGNATVLARLADVVICRVVRAWAEEHREDATGWLAAIHDPKIGRAIASIHRQPNHDWSIKALAGVACLSRSVFADRFALLVGTTPARYVTRLRMHLACSWLREDRSTVAQVCERLGYESEASFSRAFKRNVGCSPSELRREARSAVIPAALRSAVQP